MNKNSDSKNTIIKHEAAIKFDTFKLDTAKLESGRIAVSKQDIIIKITKLIQRSRQAIRVYGSLIKEGASQKIVDNDSGTDFQAISDLQAKEWRDVNIELLKRLTPLYESFLSKNSVAGSNFVVGFLREFSIVKDLFVSELRMVQSDMHVTHRGLLRAIDSNDFNKNDYISAVQSSTMLVSLKTRIQALEAVCKELNSVLPNMLSSSQNNKAEYLNERATRLSENEPLVLTKNVENYKSNNNRTDYKNSSYENSEGDKLAMSRDASNNVNYDHFVELNLEDAELVQLLRSKTSRISSSKGVDSDTKNSKQISQDEYKSRKVVPLFKKYR